MKKNIIIKDLILLFCFMNDFLLISYSSDLLNKKSYNQKSYIQIIRERILKSVKSVNEFFNKNKKRIIIGIFSFAALIGFIKKYYPMLASSTVDFTSEDKKNIFEKVDDVDDIVDDVDVIAKNPILDFVYTSILTVTGVMRHKRFIRESMKKKIKDFIFSYNDSNFKHMNSKFMKSKPNFEKNYITDNSLGLISKQTIKKTKFDEEIDLLLKKYSQDEKKKIYLDEEALSRNLWLRK